MEQNLYSSVAYILEEDEAKAIFEGRFNGCSCLKAFPDQLHTFVGDCSSEHQIVIHVPKGDILFPSDIYEGMNIIAVIGEKVSADYLEYLEDMQISYLFAGIDGDDKAKMEKILQHDFDITELRHYGKTPENEKDRSVREHKNTEIMEYITLANGVKAPILGIGTFQISDKDAENSVYEALKMGYRMIDTANAYMNEEGVGRGLKRAIAEGIVKREEVFLSTKLWPTAYESKYAVDDTLARLQVDYVDLLFLHQPSGNFTEGYKQLEKAYREGKAKSLGISNFHGEKLERLLAAAEIKPQVIQLETHPYCIHHEIIDRLEEYGTRVMGWYPLGHGDRSLVNEPVFTELAAKYGKSNAQIVLRWATQMGFMTIPGSKNPAHIKSNADIFDFSLTADEMAAIAKLDGKKQYYTSSDAVEESYASMHLPFER